MATTRSRKQSSRGKRCMDFVGNAWGWGGYKLHLVRRIRQRLREAGMVSEQGLKIFQAEAVQNQVMGGRGGDVSSLEERAAARVEGNQDEDVDIWKMDDEGEEDDEARRKNVARILMCLRSGDWGKKEVEAEEEKEEETCDEMAREKTDEQERMNAALTLTSLRYGGQNERLGERKRADERRTVEGGKNQTVKGAMEEEDSQVTANMRMLDDFLKIDPLMYWAMEKLR